MAIDIQTVTAFIEEAAHTLVLPKFSRLSADDVEAKATPGDPEDEYTDILAGLSEFVIYYRLLPWDHAAPALILTEGGGRAGHVSGQPYTARSEHQLTIVARDVGVVDQLCGRLRPCVLSGF